MKVTFEIANNGIIVRVAELELQAPVENGFVSFSVSDYATIDLTFDDFWRLKEIIRDISKHPAVAAAKPAK